MEPAPQMTPMLQKPPGYRDPNLRPPVLPPPFCPKPKRRGCCRLCCCTCCVLILTLLLLLLIAGGLFSLWYDPSLPEFHLASFRLLTLNVTEKADGAYLAAETALRVEVKNWNAKMRWRFEESRLEVRAENGDISLGWTNVGGFTVKEKEVTELKCGTSVKGVPLNEKQRRKLMGAYESKALVPSVELRTKTGVRLQGWNSSHLSLTVLCGDLTIRQLQKGEVPPCSIALLGW
ncbi:hypothetical protein RJT34_20592 [Clitoria ternatea]|uniref:Late embryogenesis abundant protein LEA-2 subgroup domain-containing protein n=1 Tax=Clitoria ternatea TaxID=43366 RepID=A0AAN9ITF1_CLITE